MERKIRVGAVSYLNTKPLLYGIEKHPFIDTIHLSIDYPSRIADMLISGKIDIGLAPVSIIPELAEYHLNTNYCIGSDGPVASVCIFSEVPLNDIDRVLLDYQSRTSVELTKILVREHWKINPELVDGGEDFRDHIHGRTAGVVIGDAALEQRKISTFAYDLGEAWKMLTELPFVFAAWISNKKMEPGFVEKFNQANGEGLDHLPLVLEHLPVDLIDLHEYYSKNISYKFDARKKKGLDLFLKKLSSS